MPRQEGPDTYHEREEEKHRDSLAKENRLRRHRKLIERIKSKRDEETN